MFDLYFAGARNRIADEYLLKCGANRLQSQLIDRRNISCWLKEKTDVSKLFIDSGAYTAHTKGIDIAVDDYIKYLNSISDKCTLFAQLDKIPGRFGQPKTLEEKRLAPELSWENYLYMYDRLNEPRKLIPVFHQGEDYFWLYNMLNWRDSCGKSIEYIGISPAMDSGNIEVFLTKSFNIIKQSSNPNVKTHAFGMTQLKLLEQYPYTSADSTSWKLSAATGSIYTPWGSVYVSDRGLYDKDYILNQNVVAKQRVISYVENLGFSFEEVAKFDYVRYIINIKFLMNWAKNYKFKGFIQKRSLI